MNASGSKLLTASWVVLLFGCLAQADVGAEDVTDPLSLFVDKSSKHKVFFATALHRELRCVE